VDYWWNILHRRWAGFDLCEIDNGSATQTLGPR